MSSIERERLLKNQKKTIAVLAALPPLFLTAGVILDPRLRGLNSCCFGPPILFFEALLGTAYLRLKNEQSELPRKS